jgi:hypothetical protein
MAEIPTPTSGYAASSRSRPLGVTILAILMIIGGLLNLFSALSGYTILDMAWSGISGIIGLILGISMWQLTPWARKASMIWYIISLLMSFVLVFALSSILGSLLGGLVFMVLLIALLPAIVIDLIIILYLNSGGVKAAFEGVGGW